MKRAKLHRAWLRFFMLWTDRTHHVEKRLLLKADPMYRLHHKKGTVKFGRN